ncbi:four helix bundle protein [Clostridium sp. YIM B02515]|uniref:Four helix bundle protein n=1 Tax=Clostridium rhizosphaerae TaxID=2803861 RepID=A0ABS1TCD7_9CLOT|nr:four helix bundle protein [Clostridium rhizosphaerae]
MHIAFKESAENKYWINLLIKAGYISESKIILLNNQLNEISKILNLIITTTKENLKQNNA